MEEEFELKITSAVSIFSKNKCKFHSYKPMYISLAKRRADWL